MTGPRAVCESISPHRFAGDLVLFSTSVKLVYSQSTLFFIEDKLRQNYDATPYQPTQSSAFSQDYSTVQSYTSSQTQPAASDLTSSTGYNAGYDTTYSAEPAYKSQAYSMPVDTTYAANRDPGTAYGAHSSHEKGKAVDRAPAPTQGGQSSWLPDTAGVTTQMYGEPEDMALDTTPFYSEDHYAGNRRGSGSGSGSFGSSKPVQYDYTESMDKVSVRCSYKVPVVDPSYPSIGWQWYPARMQRYRCRKTTLCNSRCS
ncbi:predicted protein [Sclerotinia sclerotiorum 1980 UF-70]|uniref:Uncharacterized protein n=1 Tax=Sclerotinia sclerotiorum (strain ATCC 18683 / 1980 / Ss-1) TaxID=665079 RepID=A7EXV8_SCLS1|nr:predicted protein [Sclerotinia sclerotiorum 1980 UF-70]EDN94300.1 predicted protein [Sclerotinia sclerotiorum 1980 UF-70]